MEGKLVSFDESTIIKNTSERKKFSVKRQRKKKGKGLSGPTINATTAARIYEALKSADNRDKVNSYCADDDVVAFLVGRFLEEVLEDFDPKTGNVAEGLNQFRESPGNFNQLSNGAVSNLLYINKVCPGLGMPEDSSSISSNGTLVSVDIDFDDTNEKAAFRVAIAAAFNEARKRNTNKTEFTFEASRIFNTEHAEYGAAFQYVVRDCEDDSWTGNDEAATTHSLTDAMLSKATDAFSKWSQSKSTAVLNDLFFVCF
mmetsp:Transcript_30635/g.74259  ORF Transcript_30635/g.74259 Transcript_30635/m.74259 type:complete len:257 (-) Transcript_30635:219-989(-)